MKMPISPDVMNPPVGVRRLLGLLYVVANNGARKGNDYVIDFVLPKRIVWTVTCFVITAFASEFAKADDSNIQSTRRANSSVISSDVSFPLNDSKSNMSLLDKFMQERVANPSSRTISELKEPFPRSVHSGHARPDASDGRSALQRPAPPSRSAQAVQVEEDFRVADGVKSQTAVDVPRYQMQKQLQHQLPVQPVALDEWSAAEIEMDNLAMEQLETEMSAEDLAYQPEFELDSAVQPVGSGVQSKQSESQVSQYQTRSPNSVFNKHRMARRESQPDSTSNSAGWATTAPRTPTDILINKRGGGVEPGQLNSVLEKAQPVKRPKQNIYRTRDRKQRADLQTTSNSSRQRSYRRSNNNRSVAPHRIVTSAPLMQPNEALDHRNSAAPQDVNLPSSRSSAFARPPRTRLQPETNALLQPKENAMLSNYDLPDPEFVDEREFTGATIEPGRRVSLSTIGSALTGLEAEIRRQTEHIRHRVVATPKQPEDVSTPVYANINDAFERKAPNLPQYQEHEASNQQQEDVLFDDSFQSRNPNFEVQPAQQQFTDLAVDDLSEWNSGTRQQHIPISKGFVDRQQSDDNLKYQNDFSNNPHRQPGTEFRMPASPNQAESIFTKFNESTGLPPIRRPDDPGVERPQNTDPRFELTQEQSSNSDEEARRQDEEAQQRIEIQRAEYRTELWQPLSSMPAHMAMSYVDDTGKSIPTTGDQKNYLLDFNGFSYHPYMPNVSRCDKYGYGWHCRTALWASPNYCYRPLYYEDSNLERFGARRPFLQPAISACHFFASTVLVPYKLAQDPFCECKCAAGYGRPGNRYCYQRKRFVFDPKAITFQGLLTTGIVFALP